MAYDARPADCRFLVAGLGVPLVCFWQRGGSVAGRPGDQLHDCPKKVQNVFSLKATLAGTKIPGARRPSPPLENAEGILLKPSSGMLCTAVTPLFGNL